MNERPGLAQNGAPSPDAYRRLIDRLPVTMRPALNQQLSQWGTLFPFEKHVVASFMKGVETFGPSGLGALTAPLWALETKMGVKNWNFSETYDTIENASQLARSKYYGEWRREVQRVFEALNAAARDSTPDRAKQTRLILLVLPRSLPVDAHSAWIQWGPRGHAVKISGDSERLCELVLKGLSSQAEGATQATRQGSFDSSDLWFIDAEAKLGSTLFHRSPIAASSLGYAALKPFRDRFLAELSKAPKNIRATDEIIASLRRESW